MDTKKELGKQVFIAARENGINSVLFRNSIARRLGLNITDYECLSLLTIQGDSSPGELARYTGLTSGSTTAMLDRLEKVQFIRRKPNPKDRRGLLIEINEKWRETVGPMVTGVQKAHQDLIESYSEEELKVIADFLTRFTNNVIVQTKLIEEHAS